MTKFDTIIRGGHVANASESFDCDVGIRAGRIAALGEDLGSADEIIDARGRLVLPGGIDSHVHFAQASGPGIVMADDFESGTRAAAFGGNTTVMPFCLQERGKGLRQAVKEYHAKAEGRCHIDVSFHLIISDPTPQVLGQELPALVGEGYTSFKVFMTYEDLALTDFQILEVFAVAREDQQGRGFLGFRQRTVKDLRTGIASTSSHRQDYPLAGLVAGESSSLNQLVLSAITNSYGAADLGGTRLGGEQGVRHQGQLLHRQLCQFQQPDLSDPHRLYRQYGGRADAL